MSWVRQTPLILSFMDYEQAFDSVDRRALAKVLSLYGILEKHIKVISAMHENNTAAVKVVNEVNNWFCIKSGVKQGCVLSPFMWIILMDFRLKEHRKGNGRPRNQMGRQKYPGLRLWWWFKHRGWKVEQNELTSRGFASSGC